MAWTRLSSGSPGGASGALLLAVSTLHPHKNLDALLARLAVSASAMPTPPGGWKTLQRDSPPATCTTWREAWARACRWIFPLGFRREVCTALFRAPGVRLSVAVSRASALPSWKRWRGVPTACSAIDPLNSIAGEAALRFDPQRPGIAAGSHVPHHEDDELRRTLAVAGRPAPPTSPGASPRRPRSKRWKTQRRGRNPVCWYREWCHEPPRKDERRNSERHALAVLTASLDWTVCSLLRLYRRLWRLQPRDRHRWLKAPPYMKLCRVERIGQPAA